MGYKHLSPAASKVSAESLHAILEVSVFQLLLRRSPRPAILCPMLYYAAVSQPPARPLGAEDIFEGLSACLNKTGLRASARRALAIPPDITRLHSRAGDITRALRSLLADKLTAILPALGTHTPMTPHEIHTMYSGLDHNLFREHHWKHDLHELGTIPAHYIREISGNRINDDWPVHINSMLVNGGFDLIFSIGQVVPHEIVGFANHNKNIFIGTGGADIIHRSHFLGAVVYSECPHQSARQSSGLPVQQIPPCRYADPCQ